MFNMEKRYRNKIIIIITAKNDSRLPQPHPITSYTEVKMTLEKKIKATGWWKTRHFAAGNSRNWSVWVHMR